MPPNARYYRVITLEHLKGSGKNGDGLRPEFAPSLPSNGPSTAASHSGIIAWSMQLTDDGKMAIVHYVATDRSAFAQIYSDKRPDVRFFDIGRPVGKP